MAKSAPYFPTSLDINLPPIQGASDATCRNGIPSIHPNAKGYAHVSSRRLLNVQYTQDETVDCHPCYQSAWDRAYNPRQMNGRGVHDIYVSSPLYFSVSHGCPTRLARLASFICLSRCRVLLPISCPRQS